MTSFTRFNNRPSWYLGRSRYDWNISGGNSVQEGSSIALTIEGTQAPFGQNWGIIVKTGAGSASNGVDYVGRTEIYVQPEYSEPMEAGFWRSTFNIHTKDDSLVEGDEVIWVELYDSTTNNRNPWTKKQITIIDNDSVNMPSEIINSSNNNGTVNLAESNIDLGSVSSTVGFGVGPVQAPKTPSIVNALIGTEGNDFLEGVKDAIAEDRLEGGAGNDRLLAYFGADYLDGGDGDDYMHGMHGRDQLIGGNGNDTMRGGHGHDVITGGIGSDWIWGGTGRNTVDAGISDNVRDDIYVSVDSIQNQNGNPNGVNADLLQNLGAEDKIYMHALNDFELTYGNAVFSGQQGVGIYANGSLEALVTGGLSVDQVSGMTTGGSFV
ncbi:calcium-binding protein [Prochlorococcus marinus]|uniref:calcium-binding protein n=1 Tax=Prochlorococcus marinus TaxID=1219 RepID=UPI0007BB60E7|nr:calcium-binding protein [Prochlorococcus marinus]KZR75849.1 Hemolysin, chromosomal [Prochlorococcus marinus str. MIT 1320]